MSDLSKIGRYKVWIPAVALVALAAGIRALLWRGAQPSARPSDVIGKLA